MVHCLTFMHSMNYSGNHNVYILYMHAWKIPSHMQGPSVFFFVCLLPYHYRIVSVHDCRLKRSSIYCNLFFWQFLYCFSFSCFFFFSPCLFTLQIQVFCFFFLSLFLLYVLLKETRRVKEMQGLKQKSRIRDLQVCI